MKDTPQRDNEKLQRKHETRHNPKLNVATENGEKDKKEYTKIAELSYKLPLSKSTLFSLPSAT